jgi:SAM-dependent methyltransferase
LVVAEPKAITAEGNGSSDRDAQRHPRGGPSIACDQQIGSAGFVAHNSLRLTGWATSPHGIAGVVVQVEDRVLNAAYGLDTPWLAAHEDDGLNARAGFELDIDTSGWEPGPRALTIASFDQAGGRDELTGQIEILPYEPVRYAPGEVEEAIAAGGTVMWLESPTILDGPCTVDGRLEVRGWAYAQQGLDSVRVTIDGDSIPALHPIVRPDLIERLGPKDAGEAGFVLTLDPHECAVGEHELTVVAMGRDGRNVGVSGEVVCREEPERRQPGQGEPAQVEWIEDRVTPQPRGGTGSGYRPSDHAGSLLEAEYRLRYRWAAELAPERTVLDAGCGSGWGTALLAEAGAERVVGIDPSEDALEEASKLTTDLAVELELGELDALPFDDASFDLIACFEAIESCPDCGKALTELRRVLRSEGTLLIGPLAQGCEKELREQFANVVLCRQQANLVSTILDDETRAVGGEEASLGIDVRKSTVERPGSEAHVLAVAADGALPDPGRIALLAPPRAIRRIHDSARTWEDRALRAEAEAAATRVQVNLARMHQEASVKALRERERELEELPAARTRLAEQEARLIEQNERLSEQNAQLERLGEQEERLREQDERLVEQNERLSEQDKRIWSQHEQLERQGSELERLGEQEERLREQNERLAEQNERLSEQDKRIWSQHEQLERQGVELEERATLIEAQNEQLDERGALIERQDGQLSQRDALIDSQAATLGARNVELRVGAERTRRAEAEAATWRDSTSVRLTRPLRAVGRGTRRIRNAFRRSSA